jgi:D-3-phosphoglycerate dehydrogenase
MSTFKVVLLKHGYPGVLHERQVITAAGGDFVDTDPLSQEEALRSCEDADGLLVRWVPITADIIQRLRRCKIIVRYGVGYDNVDVNAATRAGIVVGHVPNYCLDEVSTHTIGLLLACVRRIVTKHQKLQRGAWEFNPLEPLYRIAGRTLGLIGFGNIGQAVARKMGGWGLRRLATDPFVDPARAQELGVDLVPLDTLLRESDYISLHVPLLPETRHLISHRELALTKPSAILINTARGPVLDNAALIAALEHGRLAQSGLDVFEHEPPSIDSPLRRDPRIVLSDHVAWYSEESQVELRITAAEEAVRACTGGLPLAIANPEVLHRLGRFSEWVPNDNARWQLKRVAALSAL